MARLRFNPDPSAQSFQCLLTNRQSDSRTCELVTPVQTLEKDEDPFKVLRVNAHSIVAHGKYPLTAAICGGDVHVRDGRTAIFDCVADQILEYLGELRAVGREGRQ